MSRSDRLPSSNAAARMERARRLGVGIADRVSKYAMEKLAPRLYARAGFRMPSHDAINRAMEAFGKESGRQISAITEREIPGTEFMDDAAIDARIADLDEECRRVGAEIASTAAREIS